MEPPTDFFCGPPPPAVIAKRLVTEAMDAGTDDNVTVGVVFLRDLSFMT